MLHMDLHSANILLKKKYKFFNEVEIFVKLAHFSLAKICEFAQKSQTISDKYSYGSSRSQYK